eukprot:Trichotokara_eunicae@DN7278_c0_g1_i2.p1
MFGNGEISPCWQGFISFSFFWITLNVELFSCINQLSRRDFSKIRTAQKVETLYDKLSKGGVSSKQKPSGGLREFSANNLSDDEKKKKKKKKSTLR